MKSIRTYKEQGSAHTIIIVILSVALIGTMGVLFWQNFMRSDASEKTASQTVKTPADSSTKQVAEDEQKAVKSDPNAGYLVVDGWNIRFTPVGTAKIAYEQRGEEYWFTTEQWKNLGGICPTHGGLRLMRQTEKSTVLASPPIALNNEQKIGDYYYYYLNPQNQCTDNNWDKEEPEYEKVKALLATIEAKK